LRAARAKYPALDAAILEIKQTATQQPHKLISHTNAHSADTHSHTRE